MRQYLEDLREQGELVEHFKRLHKHKFSDDLAFCCELWKGSYQLVRMCPSDTRKMLFVYAGNSVEETMFNTFVIKCRNPEALKYWRVYFVFRSDSYYHVLTLAQVAEGGRNNRPHYKHGRSGGTKVVDIDLSRFEPQSIGEELPDEYYQSFRELIGGI